MPNLYEIAPPRGYVLSPYGTGKLIKKKHYKARKDRADMLKTQRENTEIKKQRLLQDKTISKRKCEGKDQYGNTVGCLEKFPDDFFFWVRGKKLCGKNANGCAANQDRKSHISKDNPTGIRHNFASTTEGRRTELYRTLGGLVARAKSRSKSENMDFDLTKEWAIKRCENYNKCCEVSGNVYDLSYIKSGYNPMCPSIDRIDNNKGYTQDNCRIIWAFFNMAFRDATIELQEKTLTILGIKK
jgi:hypothetical protein